MTEGAFTPPRLPVRYADGEIPFTSGPQIIDADGVGVICTVVDDHEFDEGVIRYLVDVINKAELP